MDLLDNVEINVEEVAKERTEGKKRIEERVKKIKAANKDLKTWYERTINGDVKKYVQKSNGNKYGYKLGNLKKNPELAKLLKVK